MFKIKNFLIIFFFSFLNLITSISYADNHNFTEILEIIQKDIKTLEKAVYSGVGDNSFSSTDSSSNLDQNSEDVLTRHLLKLSEIESQFQDLTNRFEEINFKLDKLSNRLSKVQADNQMRFQQLEEGTLTLKGSGKKLTTQKNEDNVVCNVCRM